MFASVISPRSLSTTPWYHKDGKASPRVACMRASADAFMTTEAVYIWWIALHLYAIPVLNAFAGFWGENAPQSDE